ncbi:MAG: hypothetical protein JO054_05515 [Actinobacteria bacterium]|nr:hypothetical protein [Actinomycetota bacterium]
MRNSPDPWYAHEFPDRPLVEGAWLCCCLLCAASLERCGVEDSHRHIVFHTDAEPFVCDAGYAAFHRTEEQLHDMLRYQWDVGATWITGVSVGARPGRAVYAPDPGVAYPRPHDEWPVCSHCGPVARESLARPGLLAPATPPPERRNGLRLLSDDAFEPQPPAAWSQPARPRVRARRRRPTPA